MMNEALGMFLNCYISVRPWVELASYPGLLTPAFVACSTDTRKAW